MTESTDGRRNPYLILGVPFGADPERARAAFARRVREVKAGERGSSVEDLTWALHEVEVAARDPMQSLDHYRIPADPEVLRADDCTGLFRPPPQPLARTSPPPSGAELEQLAVTGLATLFAAALAEASTMAAGSAPAGDPDARTKEETQ